MHADSFEYQVRSPVGSPVVFKKNSVNNSPIPQKYDDFYNIEKSPTSTSYKDWSSADYQSIRKVPAEINSLRQTFDVKSHSKLQQVLGKYDNDNQQQMRSPRRADLNLRQTFNGRPKFLDTYNNNNSLTVPTSTIDANSNYDKYQRSARGQLTSPRAEIEFSKYKEHIEQMETSNKMEVQLQKLKEDRRKRLEGNSKDHKNEYKPQPVIDSFKRKTLIDYYSPKYEKIDVVQTLEQSKTMPLKNNNIGNNNLEKYKYQQVRKVQSSPLQKISQKEQPSYKISNEKTSNSKNPSNQKMSRQRSQTQQLMALKIPSVAQMAPNSPKPLTNKVPSQKNSSSPVLMPGMKIRDFLVTKNLGQGKFGIVYQVFHLPTNAVFALKKVPKDVIISNNMLKQFTLELKLQTFLHHQNILTLYGYFDDSHSIYLILQYMQDGTLYSQLKKKKTLPENEVAQKIKQIALAIQYLHQNQIAHRDLKPQNIVITNNICKICDFGWATICENRRTTCCGTFDYTPPQIFQGEEYDYTVDLWCLGVLTYELLVGKAPFYHSRREQTKNRILNVQKSTISYPQHLSKNAVSFIDSLVRKDPRDRLSSQALLEHPFLSSVEEDL